MKRILNSLSLLILSSAFLPACGTVEPLMPPKGASVLEGSWSSKCIAEGKSSRLETVTFQGDVLERKAVFFTDTKCTQGSELMVARLEAIYSIGKQSNSLQGATEMDVREPKKFLKVSSAEAAVALNARKFYGFTNWNGDEEKNVTGRTSTGSEEIQKDVFTIFKKDASGLCLGKKTPNKDGSSEIKRMNTLDETVACFAFVSQP